MNICLLHAVRSLVESTQCRNAYSRSAIREHAWRQVSNVSNDWQFRVRVADVVTRLIEGA